MISLVTLHNYQPHRVFSCFFNLIISIFIPGLSPWGIYYYLETQHLTIIRYVFSLANNKKSESIETICSISFISDIINVGAAKSIVTSKYFSDYSIILDILL